MDSASDFGSEGCGFKSHLGHILCIFKDQKTQNFNRFLYFRSLTNSTKTIKKINFSQTKDNNLFKKNS